MSLTVPVDVKQQLTMFRHIHRLSQICQPTPVDMKLYIITTLSASELRSCVKVEVAVLGSPSLTVLAVSVDEKQH